MDGISLAQRENKNKYTSPMKGAVPTSPVPELIFSSPKSKSVCVLTHIRDKAKADPIIFNCSSLHLQAATVSHSLQNSQTLCKVPCTLWKVKSHCPCDRHTTADLGWNCIYASSVQVGSPTEAPKGPAKGTVHAQAVANANRAPGQNTDIDSPYGLPKS